MFLFQLYYHWKKMFYAVIFFVVLQFFFMYKAVETLPWFLFTMYSTRQPLSDTSYRLHILINNKEWNSSNLTGREAEVLFGKAEMLFSKNESGFLATDTITIRKRFKNTLSAKLYQIVYDRLTNKLNREEYKEWWLSYLSSVSQLPMDSVTFFTSRVIWNPNYKYLNDTLSKFTLYKNQ